MTLALLVKGVSIFGPVLSINRVHKLVLLHNVQTVSTETGVTVAGVILMSTSSPFDFVILTRRCFCSHRMARLSTTAQHSSVVVVLESAVSLRESGPSQEEGAGERERGVVSGCRQAAGETVGGGPGSQCQACKKKHMLIFLLLLCCCLVRGW